MPCKNITTALAPFASCVETNDGSRITTHCLYPSFEPVQVFVARWADGFHVHDGGGAARSAWEHARDDALIKKMIDRQAAKYGLSVQEGGAILAEAKSTEWLLSAILSVANASAAAAHATLERVVTATENVLRAKIYSILKQTLPEPSIKRPYDIPGKSGKTHRFDFAFGGTKERWTLIDAVAPHHVSVASKYVAFADTDEGFNKFIVHDRPLEAGDKSLLQQVADIVPIESLEPGLQRVLAK